MLLIILYLSMLIVGYGIAARLRAHAARFGFLSKALMLAVYVMVLIMGLRMGMNEQVTSNLGTIGLKSTVMTVACCVGSMLVIFVVRKALRMDRYGDRLEGTSTGGAAEEASKQVFGNMAVGMKEKAIGGSEAAVADNKAAADRDAGGKAGDGQEEFGIKSTLLILLYVAVGMVMGAFFIADLPQELLEVFDAVTSDLLVIFLCLLLFVVGFDLGLEGKVIAYVKRAGIRVMAFPFAAILGTLVFGGICGVLMGFSLKEGLAISAGFGWYTYAPTVIAEAGSQYMVASAVSFMHNVIRETAGIILVPVLAKKFGYIEACGVTGVAAADVCMPIVERSCRADTVVYSFTIGITMSLTTSVLVPVIMNL